MRRRMLVTNERGSTLALMAVILFATLALAGFAIDLASLRSARSEAQRAADAIALAGASAFRDFPPSAANLIDSVQGRSIDMARREMVRSDTLDIRSAVRTQVNRPFGAVYTVRTASNEVEINIIPHPDSQKVRAWVRHAGIATFFGGLLGVPYGHVQAKATAWAANDAPTVNCLKPFLIPDMWHEGSAAQDKNRNQYMEPGGTSPGGGGGSSTGEDWIYNPSEGDYYIKYDPANPDPQGRTQTGYGSGRLTYGDDIGLPLLLKPQTGKNQRQGNSYFTLDGPLGNLRDNIKNGCINASIGDVAGIANSPGGQTGQARQGIQYLYDQDPGATWNQSTKQVQNVDPKYGDWTKSPRVILVGLMNPNYIKGTSKNDKPDPGATFDNFARIFISARPSNNQSDGDNITAIFIGFAPGGGGGHVAGTLVKQLQLIE